MDPTRKGRVQFDRRPAEIEGEWYVADTDLGVQARVAYWADIVAPIVNHPIGATNIVLVRICSDESNMGDIVTDSMRWNADPYDCGEPRSPFPA